MRRASKDEKVRVWVWSDGEKANQAVQVKAEKQGRISTVGLKEKSWCLGEAMLEHIVQVWASTVLSAFGIHILIRGIRT